nr:hypothetical protein [Saccharopolyspora sp. HNM0983]
MRGGPKDGHEVDVATDTGGRPVPRIELPVATRDSRARAPVLVYERARRGGRAAWEFVYVGAQT